MININFFIKQSMLVALGGALGAACRFWISEGIHQYLDRGFPVATLFINVTGSLLIGFLSVLIMAKLNYIREYSSFVLIGILGGYTTFSTFSLDTVRLLQAQHFGLAFMNIFLSVGLCLLATGLGIWLTRLV